MSCVILDIFNKAVSAERQVIALSSLPQVMGAFCAVQLQRLDLGHGG